MSLPYLACQQHRSIQSNISQFRIMSIIELLKFTRTQTDPNQIDRITSLMWSIWKGHNVVAFKNENFNSIGTIIHAEKKTR